MLDVVSGVEGVERRTPAVSSQWETKIDLVSRGQFELSSQQMGAAALSILLSIPARIAQSVSRFAHFLASNS